MQQLTGIDASFLNLETSTTYGHVASMTVFDRKGLPPGEPYEIIRDTIAERIHLLAPFRRRLVEVPFGLDLPYWIEDPEFDLDFHVRHHGVPPPGDDRQLSEVVARIVGRPMDRTRPLWELYVIEGLADDKVAMLNKVHHATIDGASGAQMLMVMLDTDPDARPGPAAEPWVPEPIPSDGELWQRTMREFMRRPEKLIRLNVRMLREVAAKRNNGAFAAMADLIAQPMPGPVGQLIRNRLRESAGTDPDHATALPSTPAPKTPWNRAISPHRRFAFTSISLEDAKQVRRAFGCTFNDVVMTVCSGALRRYLERHEALPPEPLIAMVPVSIRTGSEADAYSNRVSGLLCNLATDRTDPVDRLHMIKASMDKAKENLAAIPAETLGDLTQFAPPALAARAMRMWFRSQSGDRANPPFNLIISNVPGPQQPLYSGGAMLESFFPVSAVTDGQGLNMTVQSYNGDLDFGFIACRQLMPDLWDLVDDLHAAMDELLAAAAAHQTGGHELDRPAPGVDAPAPASRRDGGKGSAKQVRKRSKAG